MTVFLVFLFVVLTNVGESSKEVLFFAFWREGELSSSLFFFLFHFSGTASDYLDMMVRL
mgnify:FL=1